MIRHFNRTALATSLAVTLAGFSGASMAANSHMEADVGMASGNQTSTVTVVLKLHNQAALEQYIQDTVTPGSRHFQQFLSTSEFASQYGASAAEIARVQAYLKQKGLSSQVLDNHMTIRATGTLAQLGAAFNAPIHNYVSLSNGQHFHRPSTTVLMPSAIADLVVATSGLSNEKKYLSHRIKALNLPGTPTTAAQKTKLATAAIANSATATAAAGNPTATGEPGSYTVGDVANFYNINPLYKRGVTGKGSTLAIVTLSNFYPADAQTYWTDIGLATKPNRITQVHVDGGSAIDSGSGETALDVEQSGGIAPDASIIVYDAPNAGNGFVDAFAQAVSDNKADSISTSWGGPEIFNFAALNVDGASITDTSDAGDLQAFHQIFLEAAAQGQSVFAASGDSGAYDTVRGLGVGTAPGTYTAPLTVDSPASDPYITAAGGTTRPYTYSFNGGPNASLTQESVWGWDYIQNYFDTNFGPGLVDVFSVGGGGGVSVYWHTPFYQLFTNGIRTSESGQSLSYNDPTAGPTTLLKLPAHFRGRNVPDIALNADPETGYLVVSTYDGGLIAEGGTSFVAPQLNGISALLTQSNHHRIGLWNPQVYAMQNIFGYGKYSPFNDIRQGDNWFYQGKHGYEPGAGIGTLDVTNLDLYLKSGLFSFRL
ncbi:subtilase family serine protease [Rhodanobacter sp. K2T2]|uniref:S53 family peptidase n=1 Tax=Rhodanobacter sp. K2T2 TaxID=2723085 RepID=UPI0015CCC29B|nr:S53 family peptidase [Rhodanobacter sp. K2T2]NYE28343.1 subtilase family serine protease [Rhodanobacter sp. K2T2]